jgi:hypothetical protein
MRVLKVVGVLFCVLAIGACGPSEAELAKAKAESEARAAAAAQEAKERAEALDKLAAERLAALWVYQSEPVPGGAQITAQIRSRENVDTDGSGAKGVRLIFRDHPSWGRSSYLVLNAGDFDCYGGCALNVTIDDAPAKKMTGRRPKTDEAIAMFINDWQSLWKMTAGAKALTIEFPVKAGGTRSAIFEVGGLDRAKMPKWDALTGTRAAAPKQP